MNKKRFLSLIISAIIMSAYVFSVISSSAEDYIVRIDSAADFSGFIKNCSLDTYSVGKTFILEKDIDISKLKNPSVPIFNGYFDGNGHKIKGFKLKKNGSSLGLFRQTGKEASISSLRLEGNINIGGTKSKTGAIVGENSGAVIGCTFKGNVKSGKYAGGIAGINNSTGIINNCTVNGTIYGEHYIGGICGQNFGQVINCENHSSINTIAKEVKLDINDINFKKLASTENLSDITDIGGICGYSTGVISFCINSGSVGYDRLGYNVGGICGRQSGFISNCENNGCVLGRKDIGGICGQLEPYTILCFSPSALENVSSELDRLQDIINASISSTHNSKSALNSLFNTLIYQTDEAKSNTDILIDKTTDLINGGINNVNDYTARLSATLNSASPHLRNINSQLSEIKFLLDEYENSLDKIKKTYESIDASYADKAIDKAKKSVDSISNAAGLLADGFDAAADALGDLKVIQSALKNLSGDIEDFSDSFISLINSVDEIENTFSDIIKNLPSGEIKNPGETLNTFKTSFEEIKTSLSACRTQLRYIYDSLTYLANKLGKLSPNELIAAFRKMRTASSELGSSIEALSDALDDLKKMWNEISEFSDMLSDAASDMRDTTKKIKTHTDSITDNFNSISDILLDFAESPELTLPSVDDDYISQKDKLSSSISDMIASADKIRNTFSSSSDLLINDFQSVSDQLFKVTDALTDSYDNMLNKDFKDITEDISETDAEENTDGKISLCKNNSEINGDINIGGICGSMAIEYDFDPEDDAAKHGKRSADFVYKTKAVVHSCKNFGKICGRKDCVGLITGKESLGTITDSLALGYAESRTGDYVGGIAGMSESVIRDCFVKCNLSGDNYVGGIAGSGHTIYGCKSIAKINKCDEFCGAIAGFADGGTISDNYFTDNGVAGIDSVSYTSCAAPVTYEQMLSFENIPDEFTYMTVSFYSDGKLFKSVNVKYGECLSDIPSPPAKKGQYSNWSIDSFDNITCDITAQAEYEDYITAIESDKNRNGLPVLIAEGDFRSGTRFELADGKSTLSKTVDCFKTSIRKNYDKQTVFHYLPPKEINPKNISVYVLKGGKFRKISSHTDGKYVVFSSDFENITVSFVKNISHKLLILIAAVILLLSAAASYFTVKKLHHNFGNTD